MTPAWATIAHASLGQLFFAILVAICVGLFAGFDGGWAAPTLICTVALFAQTILGAGVRYGVVAPAAHIAGAVLATILAMWAGLSILMQHMDNPKLRRPAMLLLSMTFSQVFLGIGFPDGARGLRRCAAAHAGDGAVHGGACRRGVAGGWRVGRAGHARAARCVSGTWRDGHRVMRDYIELTKPRITWLILMSTGIGYFFGLPSHAWREINWLLLLHTILGTGLIASGTAALNQWYERAADLKMRRTAGRPLPSGRLIAGRALAFGIALSVAGFVELWLGVNLLSGLIGAFTLASYLFLYTPMKQRTWWSTTVGAIPGAMPPMIGYAAAAGAITRESWVLFAILFLWQFPHFYSIAWMYKEDYARAGIQMLPVVDPDCRSTARQIVLYGIALIPVSLVPGMLGMTGRIYLIGALILGLVYLYSGVRVALERTLVRARAVLLTSVLYLPLIYGLMLLDRPGL